MQELNISEELGLTQEKLSTSVRTLLLKSNKPKMTTVETPDGQEPIWHKLAISNGAAQKVREWAKRYGRIKILTGPLIFDNQYRTIGYNKVVVL